MIEVLGQGLHAFGIAKGHVGLPDIEHRHLRPEDGDRRGIKAAGIEKIDAQARVEILTDVDEAVDLGDADILRQVGVIAFAAHHRVDLVERHGDLVIRLGAAHPLQPVLRGADGLLGAAAQVRGIFPFQHFMGLEHVRQARRDVADLEAGGLLVPAEDLFIDKGAGGLGHGHGIGEDVGGGFGPVGEAEKPIGGDPERAGAFAHHLRVGQACAGALEQLRDGGAIHAHGPGEGALIGAAILHGL